MNSEAQNISIQKTANTTITIDPESQNLKRSNSPTRQNKKKLKPKPAYIQSKKEKGLIYSIRPTYFNTFKGSLTDRSLKIDCREPVTIINKVNSLNYQYLPPKKNNIYSILRSLVMFSQTLTQGELFLKKATDMRNTKQYHQSWDIVQQKQKKVDLFCTFLFLIILVLFACRTIRLSFFTGYSAIRSLF